MQRDPAEKTGGSGARSRTSRRPAGQAAGRWNAWTQRPAGRLDGRSHQPLPDRAKTHRAPRQVIGWSIWQMMPTSSPLPPLSPCVLPCPAVPAICVCIILPPSCAVPGFLMRRLRRDADVSTIPLNLCDYYFLSRLTYLRPFVLYRRCRARAY